MPSRCSSTSGLSSAALKSAAVSSFAAGSGTGASLTLTMLDADWNSVTGKVLATGMYSITLPVTWTTSPTPMPAGSGLNTRMPSEVAGLPSSRAGREPPATASDWMKNEPLRTTVTTPSVVRVWSLYMAGASVPLPWIWLIGTISAPSSFWMVPRPLASPTVAPVTLLTVTVKLSLVSGVASPFTTTVKL